ncbi:MAG: deoxyribose-phosphate aldolase [Planctomycetota bacterium]|nr:deoxyribose-phosphate aldolase [Planctomycetota bacterium]MDA1141639.1 deoxyribose-phosphate aldolase [Planctomycetota bacterium]
MNMTTLAGYIDHAILHPTVTDSAALREIESLKHYPLGSLCVRPCSMAATVEALAGTQIPTCTVIGFPHGTPCTSVKVFETEKAIADGATEVDMVVNVGKTLSADWGYVRADIAAVMAAARCHEAILKVIFETDFVTEDAAKIKLCEICSDIGVDYVKTSTGFGFVKVEGGMAYTGATEHDVRLMRKHCPDTVGIKASGGIRTLEQALRFVELGATRLGTSSTVAILEKARKELGE